jgi:hypothetical protein
MAKNFERKSLFEDLNTDKHNPTHTHDDTQSRVVKETKTRRVQLLTYDSLINKMDAYGKIHGLSRAEVFEVAIKTFLEDKGV